MDTQENKHEDGFDFMGGGASGDHPMNMSQQETGFMPMNAFGDSSIHHDQASAMSAPMGNFNSMPKIDGLDGDLTPEEQDQIAKVQA